MDNANNKQPLVPAERQGKILQYIRVHGSGQIKSLADWLDVSQATVRRDLDEMSQAGLIERTHGGAVCNRNGSSFEHRYDEKLTLMEEEKKRIAQAAMNYVKSGDTIFLDSGTTIFYFGSRLSDIPNLTIFTYDIMVAYSIEVHPTSSIIVTGGIRRQGHNNVLIGNMAVEFLRRLQIDRVFLGADAIDPEFGVSNSNIYEAEIKAQAVESGSKVFLLADHSKFNKVALAKVCSLDKIDTLITDSWEGNQHLHDLGKSIASIDIV